ncbi:MAG: hypothetical protein LBL04_06980 [Bacteroidales bacterium]|nr:hypothetical protein [Bacteroidales bacterium]
MATMFACLAVMTACSGGGNKQQNQAATSESTEQAAPAQSADLKVKDTNTSNWQAVIKATREGIDIPLPDGWTVTKAREGIARDVAVDFTVGGTTTAERYGQMLFDITKAASQNGNHKVEITERGVAEGAAVGTLAEAAIIAGQTAYNWCFTETSEYKYTRQIHYSFSADGKQASLSF